MRNHLLLKLVSCSLLMVFPGASLLAETSAMVRASGPVSINSHAVPLSSALFPNDQLETGSGGSASVTGNGSSTFVSPRSIIHALDNGLDLICGRVVVNTLSDFTVKVHGWTIQPANGVKAKYEVLQSDFKVRITAVEGDLSVSDGSTTTLVAQGQSITKADSGHCVNWADTATAVTTGVGSGILVWLLLRRESVSPSVP